MTKFDKCFLLLFLLPLLITGISGLTFRFVPTEHYLSLCIKLAIIPGLLVSAFAIKYQLNTIIRKKRIKPFTKQWVSNVIIFPILVFLLAWLFSIIALTNGVGKFYTNSFPTNKETKIYSMTAEYRTDSRGWCNRMLIHPHLHAGIFAIKFCVESDEFDGIEIPVNVEIQSLQSSLGTSVVQWSFQDIPWIISKETDTTKALSRTPPQYPKKMARAKIEGFVRLKFDLDTFGRPFNIKVLESSHDGGFDKNAITAFKNWQFTRLIENGVPKIQQNLRVQLDFKLP